MEVVMKFHVRNGLPIALVLLLAPALVHAAAGRVLMAAGDAVAVRDGKEVKLAAGTQINDRDVLRTGTASNLQVRMTDESVVALKERTTLSIDQYRFSGPQDGSERAFYRLLKGGFRTISGLIGKTNRANYEVRTSVATIGIRGTAYSLALCESGSCTNANGTAAKDGLYAAVTEGKVAASNGKGAFEFVAGEAFYAPRPDVGVEKLLVPPAGRSMPAVPSPTAEPSSRGAAGAAEPSPARTAGRSPTSPWCSRRPTIRPLAYSRRCRVPTYRAIRRSADRVLSLRTAVSAPSPVRGSPSTSRRSRLRSEPRSTSPPRTSRSRSAASPVRTREAAWVTTSGIRRSPAPVPVAAEVPTAAASASA